MVASGSTAAARLGSRPLWYSPMRVAAMTVAVTA